MNPHHQDFLIIGAVEDAESTAFRQVFITAPEEIVIQFLRRRGFKRSDLASLWIYSGEDMLDSAILACSIHSLEDQQHAPFVVGIKLFLHLPELDDTFLKHFFQGFFITFTEFTGIFRVEVLQLKVFTIIYTIWPDEFSDSFGL